MKNIRLILKDIVAPDKQVYNCHKIDKVYIYVNDKEDDLKVTSNIQLLSYKDKTTYEEGNKHPVKTYVNLDALQNDSQYVDTSEFFLNAVMNSFSFSGSTSAIGAIPQTGYVTSVSSVSGG